MSIVSNGRAMQLLGVVARGVAAAATCVALVGCGDNVLGTEAGTYDLRRVENPPDVEIAVPGTFALSATDSVAILGGRFELSRSCSWSAHWTRVDISGTARGDPREVGDSGTCRVLDSSDGRTTLNLYPGMNIPGIVIGTAVLAGDTVYYGGFTFTR